MTVTVQVADFPPAFAVMVAVPAFTAVTLPSFTVAIAVFEELHVTVLSVALSGFTVAVSVASAPSSSDRVVLFSVTEVTATVAFVTVTVQVADFPPAFAVMVAVPAFTAVTLPSFTVAIAVFEELHVTVLSVALSGFTVAVSVASPPSTSDKEVLSNVTEVTATVAFVTVTEQVAVFSPAFDVMVAVPAFTAVTLPSFTVATAVFEELHVTVLSVASSGFTVAVSV